MRGSITSAIRSSRRSAHVDLQATVAADAAIARNDGSQVYVEAASGTARLRPVKTGVTVDSMTEVMHGVQAGDTVVFDGQSRLNPGVHVTVKTVDANAATGTGASAPANTELPS